MEQASQASVRSRAEQVDDEEFVSALQEAAPRVMALFDTPGLGVAVGRAGQVIWEQGFGYANLATEAPMTPDSVAKSGSIGKTYTATAIMQLVERGVLGLDDAINRHLPFEVKNPLGERDITIRDLLTHRSGLGEDEAGSDFAEPGPLAVELPRRYAEERNDSYYGLSWRWATKVGERSEYSNLGIATLGYIVERVNPEGATFPQYVQTNIMNRLGMTSSMYPSVQSAAHVPPDLLSRLTTGYATIGKLHLPTPEIYFADHPAGTAILRAGDHLRLLLAYMGGGTFEGATILKSETVDLMLSRQAPDLDPASIIGFVAGPGGHVGLVWFVSRPGRPDEYFHHEGGHMWGWINLSAAYPALDFAIVTMANQWPLIETGSGFLFEGGLLAEFAAQWLLYERPGLIREGQERPWGWRAAYYAGLIMGDRLHCQLGMPSGVTDRMIDELSDGALGVEEEWDVGGFRAGVEDVLKTDGTLEATQALLHSEALRVAPAELLLLHREIGGTVADIVVGEEGRPWGISEESRS